MRGGGVGWKEVRWGAQCLDKRTTEQDMEVYSLWVCRFGWGAASAHTHTVHTNTHTQLWECSRWRAKSPFLLHIYSLSFSIRPVIPPFLPLDLCFSFIPHFFLCHKLALLLLKGGRKESVEDTEELANSNEKLGGKAKITTGGNYGSACVCAVLFWVW